MAFLQMIYVASLRHIGVWLQLAADGEEGPFLQAVLEWLIDVANAAPSLLPSCQRAVEALLAEDDPQLAVTAARVLAAASSAMRSKKAGAGT